MGHDMKIYMLFVLGISMIMISIGVTACSPKYTNPPQSLQDLDLVGTWQTSYEEGRVDTIIIEANGIYRQKYIDKNTNYVYETDWNSWRIENNPNGSIYIHFSGGRYYLAGIRIAELNGKGDPCPSDLPDCISGNNPRIFYDPYSKSNVEMLNELVLTVRTDSHGNFVLNHMWTSSDRGFAILGGETEIFHRVDIPISTPRNGG
jgi:hypothetical protein